jgi:hypothetical protein
MLQLGRLTLSRCFAQVLIVTTRDGFSHDLLLAYGNLWLKWVLEVNLDNRDRMLLTQDYLEEHLLAAYVNK